MTVAGAHGRLFAERSLWPAAVLWPRRTGCSPVVRSAGRTTWPSRTEPNGSRRSQRSLDEHW